MTNHRFLLCLLTLLCAAIALVWMGRYTNIDLFLADAMFDFQANLFPWRDHWFFDSFMHQFMKALLVGVGLVPAAALAADCVLGWTLLDDRTRRRLAVVVASTLLIPFAISEMKTISIHHCPWSLERYGGFAPYLRILDDLPAGVSAGRCFPAGHASSGLWIASVAAFWLPDKPGRAMAAFGAGLMPGMVLGWAQQMRGAHFLTHTLWSAWIAALIILVLAQTLLRSPSAPRGDASSASTNGCQKSGARDASCSTSLLSLL